jgi:hypothetical protein
MTEAEERERRSYASETAPEDQCCETMLYAVRAGDLPVEYIRKYREWGISYVDGGSAIQMIQFCPWCGCKLPESLRDEWFDRIERLGFDPGDLRIPAQMQDDRWWKVKAS